MGSKRQHIAQRVNRTAERDPIMSVGATYLADTLRRDPPGQWSDNRYEQSNHYRGVLYIAIRSIMDALYSTTITLNKKHHKYAAVSLRRLEKAMPTPHANSSDERMRPFDDPDHSLVKLLDQPNRTETFNELLAQLVLQYHLTGSGLMWANPNKLGLPAELYILPTALCTAQPATPDYPEGWWRVTQYYPGGGFGILPSPMSGGGAPIDGRDLLRFKNPHPLWRFDAMSPLTAGSVQLDILESIDQARWTAMDQGLTPDMILLAPGVNQAQLDAHLERLKATNIGKRNFRKVMALGGDQGDSKFDVKFPSTTAKDMDFSSGWDQMTAYALALFGVPKSVAGLATTGSYAELYAALKQFHTLTLRPLVQRLGVWLTKHLARVWSDDLAIQLDLPTIDDQQLHEQQLSTDLAHDLLTFNEARSLRGRKPMPGGDVLVSVFVQKQQAKAQQEQQAQQPQPAPAPGGDPSQAAAPADAGQPSSPNATPAAPAAPGQPAPDAAQPAPNASADPLQALLGQQPEAAPEEATGDTNHIQNATVEAALAALGMPKGGDTPSPNGIEKGYIPAFLKANGSVPKKPKVPTISDKVVKAPTATKPGAGPKTPSTSDALNRDHLDDHSEGDEYAGTKGPRKQVSGTSTPLAKPQPAPNPSAPKPSAVKPIRVSEDDALTQAAPGAPSGPASPARKPGAAYEEPAAPVPTGVGVPVSKPTASPPAKATPVRPPGAATPTPSPNANPASGGTPGQPHQEGQVFQAADKTWRKIVQGQAVPTPAPNAQQPGATPAQPSTPQQTYQGGDTHVAPEHLDAVATALLGGSPYIRLHGNRGSAKIENGADLGKFLANGGELPQDTKNKLAGSGLGPPASAAPAPAAPAPLSSVKGAPFDVAKKAGEAGQPLPQEHIDAAAATLSTFDNPKTAEVLGNVAQWAHAHAQTHARAVAEHFKISEDRARVLLTQTISAIAFKAAKQTSDTIGPSANHTEARQLAPVQGGSATLRDRSTGKTLGVNFDPNASNPRSVHARNTVRDVVEHLGAGHDLQPSHAADFVRALDHLTPEELRRTGNSLETTMSISDRKETERLFKLAAQKVKEKQLANSTVGAKPGGEGAATPTPSANAVRLRREPPVAPGHVRLYHGGADPTTGGGRWVTGDRNDAEGWANRGNGIGLHYVDVPHDHPAIKDALDETEYSTGERNAKHIRQELPESLAKNLKPIGSAPASAAAPKAPLGEESAPATTAPAAHAELLAEHPNASPAAQEAYAKARDNGQDHETATLAARLADARGKPIPAPNPDDHAAVLKRAIAQKLAGHDHTPIEVGRLVSSVAALPRSEAVSLARSLTGQRVQSRSEALTAIRDALSGNRTPNARKPAEWFATLPTHAQEAVKTYLTEIANGNAAHPPKSSEQSGDILRKLALEAKRTGRVPKLESGKKPKPEPGAIGKLAQHIGTAASAINKVNRGVRGFNLRAPDAATAAPATPSGAPDLSSPNAIPQETAPTTEELASARLGRTLHSNVQVRHAPSGDWVVKGRNGKLPAVQNEATASGLARAIGLDVPQVHHVKLHGQDQAVVRHTAGTDLSSLTEPQRREALAKVPRAQIDKHALFDYLIGSSDPNNGNYLVTPEGKLTAIDKEQSLSHGQTKNGTHYRIPFFLADAGKPGASAGDYEFSPESLAHMVDAGDHMADLLRKQGKPRDAMGVQRRTAVLKNLAESGQPVSAVALDKAGHEYSKSNPPARGLWDRAKSLVGL